MWHILRVIEWGLAGSEQLIPAFMERSDVVGLTIVIPRNDFDESRADG
jgi:hypothetical protein